MLKKIFRSTKRSSATAAHANLSSDYLFEEIGDSKQNFVFGLDWLIVLGDVSKESYRIARKNKADFYITGSSRSNTVGYLKFNKELGAPDAKQALYSIAAVFARSLPRNAFVVRFMTPRGIWFMAAHEGIVEEGTDCFYESYEETQQILNHLRDKWGDVTVYGDLEGDEEVPDISSLMPYIGSMSRLKRVSFSLNNVPSWVWFGLAVAVGYTAYDKGTSEWKKYKRQQRLAQQQLIQVDPVAEWGRVINQWASKTVVNGSDGVESWTHGISNVPAYIGRWEMAELSCDTYGRCSGRYSRMPTGSLDSFEQFMPETWEHHIVGLDAINVNFQLSLGLPNVSELGLGNLPDLELSKKKEINLLQSILPMASEIEFTDAIPASLHTPKQPLPEGGQRDIPFPADSNLILPHVSSFFVAMPLRGFLALNWQPNYAVKQIVINRVESDSTMSDSWLQLKLKGEYYVQK